MNLFESLTKNRYQNKNAVSSFQFIDFIITEVHNINQSAPPSIPKVENEITQQLVAVAKNIFTFSRYEPHNPYILHKRVPSARNIHPNEGYLVLQGHILRVNPRSCQLDYIGYNPSYQNKIYLCVVSELWRVMKYYGEFGLSLSLLDAGHILAEIKKELEHRGFGRSILWEHWNNPDFLSSLGLNFGMYLNYVIDLSPYLSDKKQMVYPSPNHSTEVYSLRDKSYEEEVGQFRGVTKFLKSWEYRKAVPKKLIPNPNPAGRKGNNLKSENYRNSNHSYYGLFSLTDRISFSMVHKIAKTILEEIVQYVNQSYQYSIYLLYCNEAGNHQLMSIKQGKVYP